ncbi:MAG: two-component regulator propeller domain-containing protein, partial [Candidatus Paceibacterota bacterium]
NLWYSANIADGKTIFGFFNTNEPKKIIKEYFIKESITVLFQDKNNLWIGTIKGVYNYNLETKKTIKLNKSSGVSPRSISKTSDNTILITTYGNGFYMIRNNELLRVPSDTEGLLNHAH